MLRKIVTPLIAFALACATLSATFEVAFAKESPENEGGSCKTVDINLGQDVVLNAGRAGVVLPKSAYAGELEVCRQAAELSHISTLRLVSPVIYWTVEKNGEQPDRYLHGSEYVFFDLTSHEQSLWKSGELAIYHWDATIHTWVRLPTFAARNGATLPSELYARPTAFGFYALGHVIQ